MTKRRARRVAKKKNLSVQGGLSIGLGSAAQKARDLFDLALHHFQSGRSAEAAEGFLQVLTLDPHHAESLTHLGLLAYRAGQNDLARGFFLRATSAEPRAAVAHFNLGLVLQALGHFEQASTSLHRVLALTPNFAPAHLAIGNGFHLQQRLDEAAAAFTRAIGRSPNYAAAYMNLSNVRREQRRLTEAAAAGRRATELDPSSAVAWRNLALIYQDQGLVAAAVRCLEQALTLAPDFAEAQSGRLFCLNYEPSLSPEAIVDAHRRWGDGLAARMTSRTLDFANSRDPDRRLRVGFVSGDLHTHPVGYFLKSVMLSFSRSSIEVFCYSNNIRHDATTETLRQSSDHWRTIVDMADETASQLIRSDEIDILVDLSGHTASNRLVLFNQRPAPVQVTWLGYVATSGLPAIDYVISDADLAPDGSDAFYTENLVRLPLGRFCYAPPDDAPSPALSPGRPPMFGSFNDIMKLNAHVISAWATILKETPNAHLRLKWMAFADLAVQARITEAFNRHGVDSDRIEYSGYSPHAQMLAEYSEIDVALDPFPFCGGLTTCEALWMGVPVVTLPAVQAASRQSLGFLNTLGLRELAASSIDDYVAIAGQLIGDPERVRALRQSLRPRMRASPLTNAQLFTPTLEAALRNMWRLWCAGRQPRPFKVI